MKNFNFLWSSLLLVVTTGCIFTSLTMFVSVWFILGALLCLTTFHRLVIHVGTQAKMLSHQQRYKLVPILNRHGFTFLLIAIGCACYITKHPMEQNIISTSLGIACFCNFILSHALRNFLGSWLINNVNKFYSLCSPTSGKLSLVFLKKDLDLN